MDKTPITVRDTEFFDFDKFLFATWRDKPNGKGKEEIAWGVMNMEDNP